MEVDLKNIKFDDNGLIPSIVQNVYTGEVLMLAYMNKESLDETLKTSKACFYSRSRQKLWVKGETSGNYMNVINIKSDCDNDALLLQVIPDGPACHTGNDSCFYTAVKENNDIHGCLILDELFKRISDRKQNPVEGSYTNYLFDKGIDKILKKVGEESAETIIASKNNSKTEIRYEASDLLYHLMVLLVDRGLKLDDIYDELTKRYNK